jgi:threonine dehydratase
MGIEILEQVPNCDVIVCPVGGAGLIAGVSLAVKTLRPSIQVISVEPENCASYKAAVIAGHPVNAFKEATLADGLAVPVVGAISFEVARRFVDEEYAVSELLIARAVLRLLEEEKIVAEGGGATGLAALLPGGPLHMKFKGKNVVIPLCGGNIDTTVMHRVIERGLAADQRLARFTVTVSDRPGGIAALATLMAGIGVSIKDIHHERAWVGALDKVNIHCVVETTGAAHTEQLYSELVKRYVVHKDSAFW